MWRIVSRWLNIGTSEELGFIANTRIRTINLAAISGGSVSLIFTLINLQAGNYLLAIHTFANLLLLASLLYFNATGNYLKGPALIMILLSVALSSNGLLFNNGMEFYVLLVVCLGLILFDNLKTFTLILFINSVLFLVAHKLAPRTAIYPAIAHRQFVNMAIWLVLLLLCLYYFKKQNLLYLRQVEIANQRLKESNRSKEKLFSIVAHDMRSPLNALTSTLDLLSNAYIDETEFKKLSRLLANQTKHLNENMDVLLKWANSQLRGIEAHPKPIDICTHIAEIIKLLQPLMDFKQITATLDCSSPVIAYADADHVQLILRNLITNAIKFSHTGGSITISADTYSQKEVWIHVQDTGVGMETAVAKQLFVSSVIHSSTGTQNEKGLGLGLQLSQEFVQKNGGRITVISEPGKGSRFSFSLPAADQPSS